MTAMGPDGDAASAARAPGPITSITGNGANNVINGGGGNDELKGGGGHDLLTGGAGTDHFIFSTFKAGDSDTITDFFAPSDTIFLDSFTLGALLPHGNLSNATFWASAAGVAHDAEDRVIYNTTTGQLFLDADGNGAG